MSIWGLASGDWHSSKSMKATTKIHQKQPLQKRGRAIVHQASKNGLV